VLAGLCPILDVSASDGHYHLERKHQFYVVSLIHAARIVPAKSKTAGLRPAV
jgi:hypothetical protein